MFTVRPLLAVTSPLTDEVEITPLISDVNTPVDVAKVNELDPITNDVALTPFTVVVSVLPERVVVSELMILATLDVMPFIIVVNKLAEDVATFELIIDAEEALPAIIEVMVLFAEVKLFVGLGIIIEVVEITPFIFELRVCVVVA